MFKKLDLTDRVFGRLVAVDPVGYKRNGTVAWSCLCECGNIKVVGATDLMRGATKSCGCLRRERIAAYQRSRAFKIIPGARYGRLTVVSDYGPDPISGRAIVKCKCDCGNYHFAQWGNDRQNIRKSYGCLKRHGALKNARTA